MGLLDLPAELFHQVVHNLVQVAEPHGAWKLREVCRLFAAEIEYSIFAKQRQDVFASNSSKKLLRKYMWLYLFHRTKNTLDASEIVPNDINAMIGLLRERSSKGAALGDQQLREMLCKAASRVVSMRELGIDMRNCHHLEQEHEPALDYMHQYHVPIEDVCTDVSSRLAAASTIGDAELLKDTLNAHNWKGTCSRSMFGDIISNSFLFNHPHILETFSDLTEGLNMSSQEKASALSSYPSMRAVEQTMKSGNSLWVERHLEFFHKCLQTPEDSSIVRRLLSHAIICCNSSVAATYLDSDFVQTTPVTGFGECDGLFEFSCRKHDVDVVARLWKFLSMSVDGVWYKSTPLVIAVNYGTAAMVAALVDAGEAVDGVGTRQFQRRSKYWTRIVPIQDAMRRGDEDIIQALLDRGARVGSLEVKSGKEAVYNLLRDAKMKETGLYVRTYLESTAKAGSGGERPCERRLQPCNRAL